LEQEGDGLWAEVSCWLIRGRGVSDVLCVFENGVTTYSSYLRMQEVAILAEEGCIRRCRADAIVRFDILGIPGLIFSVRTAESPTEPESAFPR